MNVSVLVPFAGESVDRGRALDWVRSQYRTLGYEVETGYGNPDAWCKADAVANALQRATGDLLVIADADCFTPRVAKAVWWVSGGHVPWAIPYTSVYRLTEQATEQVLRGEEPTRALASERLHDAAIGGGIVVLPRATYEQIPLDGRFTGWGGEDFAWGYALSCLAGPPGRLSGLCWHLWHPPAYDRQNLHGHAGSPENEALRHRFEAARRDPDAMRALIEEGRCSQTRPSPSSTAPVTATSTAT